MTDEEFIAFIRRVLPGDLHINQNLAYRESGCSFGLRKQPDELGIKYELDAPGSGLPPGSRRGEAVFICKAPNRHDFVVAIVELKHGKTKDAFAQLAATSGALCASSSTATLAHGQDGDAWRQRRNNDLQRGWQHGGLALGLILAKAGITLWQDEVKKLRSKHKVKLARRQPRNTEKTVEELYTLLRQ